MADKPKKSKPGSPTGMGPPPQSPEQKLWDQVAFNEWKEIPAIRYTDQERAKIAAARANAFMDERAKHEGKYDVQAKNGANSGKSKPAGGKKQSGNSETTKS